jgi:hypothetical protein
MPILADSDRAADPHNPRGYFEYTPVKRLREYNHWLPRARGHAVKIISFLLPSLPEGEHYRVLYVERNLDEVLASQAAMLGESGETPHSLDATLRTAWQTTEERVAAWLAARPGIAVLPVPHAAVLAEPVVAAQRMADFLGRTLDTDRMAAWVDRGLHRQRGVPPH